jgi:hypothetical protein
VTTTPWVPLWPLAPQPNRVRLPVRLRVPRSSTLAGNTAFSVAALTAHDIAVWEFANNVEGRVHGYVLLPTALAAAPVGEIRLLTASAVTTGNMRWRVATKSVADGQSLNPATLTAEAYQSIAAPAALWGMKEVVFPLTEVLAPRGILLVEVTRDGGNALDTNEGSAYVLEAYLEVSVG